MTNRKVHALCIGTEIEVTVKPYVPGKLEVLRLSCFEKNGGTGWTDINGA